MRAGRWRVGVVMAAALCGCTYHTHIHNHLPAPVSYLAPAPEATRPAAATPAPRAFPLRPGQASNVDRLVGLLDGSFSSGRLDPGWEAGGVDGGFAAVVTQGHAWSVASGDITFPTPPHAALIRGAAALIRGAAAPSVGMLISKPFIVANKRLVWKQLSEALDVVIAIEVEDATGAGVLAKTDAPPSVGAFQAQELDVSAACGRPVRVHVRQHTQTSGETHFTVIDDVAVVGEPCGSNSPYQPTHL